MLLLDQYVVQAKRGAATILVLLQLDYLGWRVWWVVGVGYWKDGWQGRLFRLEVSVQMDVVLPNRHANTEYRWIL